MWCGAGVVGGEGRRRCGGRGLAPREARLQLARRPLMTGVPSSHAFFAASASLNVTCLLFVAADTHVRS